MVIHEAGHFLFARLFRVRVTEFFLGMPSRIRLAFRSKKYGTLFGVTPVLLGGYNRICGMEGEETDYLPQVLQYVLQHGRVDAADVAREFSISEDEAYEALTTLADWASIEPYYNPDLGEYEGQKDWPRAFQNPARDANLNTIYDPACNLSAAGAIQPGEAWTGSVDAQEFYDRERSHTYLGCSFGKRLAMLVAGPAFNLITAVVIVFCVLAFIGVDVASNSTRIGAIVPDSLAQAANIQAGDEFVSIDGVQVSSWEEISAPIQAALAKGDPFQVELLRNGETLDITVTPQPGESYSGLGVYASTEKMVLSKTDAFIEAVSYAGQVASHVVKLLIPTQTMEVLDQSSSVVGIANIASQAAASGIADLLMVAAAVSMSLCFMNLLPIPPLDGGKILFEIIELIRKKPLSKKAQAIVSYIGLAFFLFVFIYVLRLDILRIFAG